MADVTLAAGGVPNTRGKAWQDRWIIGQSHRGAWLVLADGIGGGAHGDRAAEAAVQVAARCLAATVLDEVAAAAAIDAAQAAVQPWYPDGRGGTTLSIVTLTDSRLVAATVGDSPVLSVTDGRATQLSPASEGPLRSWIGTSETVVPWVGTWPLDAEIGVLVCSDGLAADAATFKPGAEPRAWIDTLLTGHRRDNGDDATVLAAVVRPPADGVSGCAPPPNGAS
jgi:hypothetical protein